MCEAAPGQKICRTRLAFAGKCVWPEPASQSPEVAPRRSRRRRAAKLIPASPERTSPMKPRRPRMGENGSEEHGGGSMEKRGGSVERDHFRRVEKSTAESAQAVGGNELVCPIEL